MEVPENHQLVKSIGIEKSVPNFGLSVNGSQLTALVSLSALAEYGFIPKRAPFVPVTKNHPGVQKVLLIEELILEGRIQESKDLLGQEWDIPQDRLQSSKGEALDALSQDISVKEAVKKFTPEGLYDFIQSLQGKPFNPNLGLGKVFLTELGVGARINEKSNELIINMVRLPADQQSPLCISQDEIYGSSYPPSSDALRSTSKLQILAELARRHPWIYLHVSKVENVPDILNSGDVGARVDGGGREIYTQPLRFLPDQYAFSKKVGKYLATSRKENINLERDILGNQLDYLDLKGNSPIIIFSNKLRNEVNMINAINMSAGDMRSSQYYASRAKLGEEEATRLARQYKESSQEWMANANTALNEELFEIDTYKQNVVVHDSISLKDTRLLIAIWVTPVYREHLLRWILTWNNAKRKRVFGDRKPEEVLISSVKDLPK